MGVGGREGLGPWPLCASGGLFGGRVGAGCTHASVSLVCVCVLCVRVSSIRKAAAALWAESHYKQFQMWRLARGPEGL